MFRYMLSPVVTPLHAKFLSFVFKKVFKDPLNLTSIRMLGLITIMTEEIFQKAKKIVQIVTCNEKLNEKVIIIKSALI